MSERKTPSTPPGPRRARLAVWLAVLLPVLVAALLYLPSLRGELVMDDPTQLRDDSFIRTTSHWRDVLTLRLLMLDVIDFNRPVQVASLMIDTELWGVTPAGYRFTNLLLHAACTGLVAWVVLQLLQRPGRWRGVEGGSEEKTSLPVLALAAGLAALLFAAHPIMVEAVAVPTNREDLLVALFTLLALTAAMGFDTGRRLRAWGCGIVCAVCCFLAIGAKESGVAAPAALGLYGLVLGRHERRRSWAVLIGCCAAGVAAFLVARFTLAPTLSTVFTEPPTRIAPTHLGVFLEQTRVLTFQAWQLVWPARLSIIYDPNSLVGIDTTSGLFVVGILVIGAIVLAMRDRRLMLALGIVAAGLAPVSNLIPIFNPIADRYLYLPMIGLVTIVAVFLASVTGKWSRPVASAVIVTALVAITALGVGTVRRVGVFHDEVLLTEDAMAKNPRSSKAKQSLSQALIDANRPGEAVPIYQNIVLARPNYGDYWWGMAMALEMVGRKAEADNAFLRAVVLDPRYAQVPKRDTDGPGYTKKDEAVLSLIKRYRGATPGAPSTLPGTK
ncbi:MAG: tetratricopeptide repeat protein [Planctomycetes bacterium]|nr:tetratricopeptide repeat protein [Planctomycetota bacterium]